MPKHARGRVSRAAVGSGVAARAPTACARAVRTPPAAPRHDRRPRACCMSTRVTCCMWAARDRVVRVDVLRRPHARRLCALFVYIGGVSLENNAHAPKRGLGHITGLLNGLQLHNSPLDRTPRKHTKAVPVAPYIALVPQMRAHQAGTSCQQPVRHSRRVLEAHRTAQVLAAAVNRSATQTADGKAAACHAVVDVAAAACQLVCTCPALWRRRSRTKSDLHCAARPRAATEVAAIFGCVRTLEFRTVFARYKTSDF